MLSGMFLLDPQKALTFRALFFRHILRIVLALAAWSVIYALFGLLLAGGPITGARVVAALKDFIWGKLHYHLWFLPMIVGLYRLPVLRPLSGARPDPISTGSSCWSLW